MDFHEYKDHYSLMKQYAKRNGEKMTAELHETYNILERASLANGQDDAAVTGMIVSELTWWVTDREYYNVFPAIANVMAEFKMSDLPFKSLFGDEQRAIAIHFAKGHEVDGVESLVVALHPPTKRHPNYGLALCTNPGPNGMRSIFSARMAVDQDKTLGEACSQAEDKYVLIALATLLLDRDPEFIEPHILAKDAGKWKWADEEHRAALMRKAEKARGRRGFLIGARMETVPHIRRPHLARRWYGKGRKKLKFVMVKGSIVHREKVVQVPTGKAKDV